MRPLPLLEMPLHYFNDWFFRSALINVVRMAAADQCGGGAAARVTSVYRTLPCC